jgi:type II secretory pathway pseudopilin PulG
MRSTLTGSPGAWRSSIEARRGPSAARGFSVLEVLVAFVILSLVGTALFGLFSGALTNVAAAEEYSRAALVADSVLAVMAGTPPLREGSKSGTTEDGRIEWTATIAPYVTPQANPEVETASMLMPIRLWQIVAEVTFPGANGKPRTLKLATVRLGPREVK